MNIEEATEFIDEIMEAYECPPWAFPLGSIEKLKFVKALLWRGERYEEMWKWLKEKIYTKGGTGISADIDNIEERHFGFVPKSVRERTNVIIDKLNSIGVAVDIKELTDLLIELRDREE